MIARTDAPPTRVGAHGQPIIEALLRKKPEWNARERLDQPAVTAIYAWRAGQALALLSFDVCELPRREIAPIQQAVAKRVGMAPECVHAACTHTHASSMDATEHDLPFLAQLAAEAVARAQANAAPVGTVEFLRVDVGRAFNVKKSLETT